MSNIGLTEWEVDEIKRETAAMSSDKGWIGVDLDGTLAYYDGWRTWSDIGAPIVPMQKRVMRWLAEGRDVRIVTARVGLPIRDREGAEYVNYVREHRCRHTGAIFSDWDMVEVIQTWCLQHLGSALLVQCHKDLHMTELWDDRAVQVIPNTGMPLGLRSAS